MPPEVEYVIPNTGILGRSVALTVLFDSYRSNASCRAAMSQRCDSEATAWSVRGVRFLEPVIGRLEAGLFVEPVSSRMHRQDL